MSANPEAAPAPEKRGVYLYDWEYNGRDDSDFHVLFWDVEAGEPRRVAYGTTRCAWNGSEKVTGYAIAGWADHRNEPAELPPEAREWLRARVLEILKSREAERILHPRGEIAKGSHVAFARPYTSRKMKLTVPAGTEGVVVWSGVDAWSVPRFKNSYKVATYRAGVKLASGETVFVSTSALRLDEEPRPLAEMEEEAARYAANATGRSFYAFFSTSAYSLL